MYEIIKEFNESTKLSYKDGNLYVLKKLDLGDVKLYKSLMKIDCPNLAKIYEIITLDNQFFVVEQFIQGVTLQKYLDDNGALSQEQAKPIIFDICDGLSELHTFNIVHRDINPNNIIITNDGRAVIIDFGISRINKPTKSADTQILGTQGYAAPEQFGFSQTSHKADIYSLGILINYMLTLHLPSEELCSGIYQKIVIKATRIDVTDRYNSVAEIKKDIDGKNKLSKIVRNIPGFRTHKLWKEVVAFLGYFAIGLVSYIYITSASTTKGQVLYLASLFFGVVVPVFILTDFLYWSKKWSFTANKSKSDRLAWKIFFVFISIVISLIFIILIPE